MTLEQTYRRLLACYPREHRRQYEHEMLGVLLDDAGPDQRRPRAGDVLDLLSGALRTHVRYAAGRLAAQPWRDAAAALGLFAPLALFAYAARLPALDLALLATTRTDGLGAAALPSRAWLLPVAWLAVAVLAGFGWRRTAAALAAGAAAVEVARAAVDYTRHLSVFDLWPAVLAGTAVAALAVSTRPGVAVIARWRLGVLAGAALLVAGAPAVTAVALPGLGAEPVRTTWIFTTDVGRVEALLLGAGYLLFALTVLSAPAALRWRLAALLVPAGVTLLLTRVGIFLDRPVRNGLAAPLDTGQWLALALAPLLMFAVAVAALHRRERPARLLALDAERTPPGPPR